MPKGTKKCAFILFQMVVFSCADISFSKVQKTKKNHGLDFILLLTKNIYF